MVQDEGLVGTYHTWDRRGVGRGQIQAPRDLKYSMIWSTYQYIDSLDSCSIMIGFKLLLQVGRNSHFFYVSLKKLKAQVCTKTLEKFCEEMILRTF